MISLEKTIEYARSFIEVSPVIQKGREPDIKIANDVMQQILKTPCQCYRFPLKESTK